MDILLEHPLPQNAEAERLILGCILLDNGLMQVAGEWLKPGDFYIPAHRPVYDAMAELARAQKAIDPLTLQTELERRNQLEQVGGAAYIAHLFDGVPRFSNIENYCRIVAECSLRRHLVAVLSEYTHQSVKSEDTADELLDKIQRDVMAIQSVGRKERWESMAALGERYLDKLEYLAQQDRPLTGLSTGFEKLDRITGGLQPGTLTILAARPSIGKSALALNIADGAVRSLRNDRPVVGIFSLEMSAEELASRYMAMRGQVNSAAFRTGRLKQDDWRSLADVLKSEDPGRIFVDDRPGLNTTEMRSLARRLAQRAGRLDLLIVDYLQIIRSSARGEQRYRQLGLIAEDLKAIGKDFSCPVIAVCALGREAEDHEPSLRDLRESGDLEFVADLVWFLHGNREEEVLDFIQAKQRNGPLGKWKLQFDKHFSRFSEA